MGHKSFIKLDIGCHHGQLNLAFWCEKLCTFPAMLTFFHIISWTTILMETYQSSWEGLSKLGLFFGHFQKSQGKKNSTSDKMQGHFCTIFFTKMNGVFTQPPQKIGNVVKNSILVQKNLKQCTQKTEGFKKTSMPRRPLVSAGLPVAQKIAKKISLH